MELTPGQLICAESEIEICYFTDCDVRGIGGQYHHDIIDPSTTTSDGLREKVTELEQHGALDVTVYIDHEIAYECGEWLMDEEGC